MKKFFKKLIASLVVGLAAFLLIFIFCCAAVKMTVFVLEICHNFKMLDIAVTIAAIILVLLSCILAYRCSK